MYIPSSISHWCANSHYLRNFYAYVIFITSRYWCYSLYRWTPPPAVATLHFWLNIKKYESACIRCRCLFHIREYEVKKIVTAGCMGLSSSARREVSWGSLQLLQSSSICYDITYLYLIRKFIVRYYQTSGLGFIGQLNSSENKTLSLRKTLIDNWCQIPLVATTVIGVGQLDVPMLRLCVTYEMQSPHSR